MLRPLFAAVLTVGALAAGSASASDHSCNVPMAEWQPREALQQKLQAQGWEVRRIKTEDGCYEVYAIDSKGTRIEAVYDPKSLEMIKTEKKD